MIPYPLPQQSSIVGANMQFVPRLTSKRDAEDLGCDAAHVELSRLEEGDVFYLGAEN